MNKARERKPMLPFFTMDGSARVWLLSAAITLAGIALYVAEVRELSSVRAPLSIPWWALAMLFGLAEVFVVHLQFRRDAHSISLSEIPLVLGLFFTSPQGFVAAQVIGAALALGLHRRQSPLKLLFNTSHLFLGASLAVVIFHAGFRFAADPIGPVAWGAAALATLAATSVGALTIVAAISLSEGRARSDALPSILSFGMLVTATNTALGLVAITILWREPPAAALLLLPIVILFIAYRLYTSEREKHDSLESLYSSTRVLHRSLKVEEAIISMLSETREMFRAEIADITLFASTAGGSPLRTTLGPENRLARDVAVELDASEGLWARAVSQGQPVLLARPIENERLRRHYEREGVKDIMVAPLHGDAGPIGFIRVVNRLGDVSTFDEDDLKLFETLAYHASASLENARLVSRLEDSLEHLKRMNELKDDFVAAVSHELRTPLTSIQGYVKTLLRPDVQWPADQQREFLGAIDRQGDRLRTLIEDLLAVSRLEGNGDNALTAESVSLAALVDEAIEGLGAQAAAHHIVVTVDDALPVLLTDGPKLHQIVSNLLDNAVKYAPKGTEIGVAARCGNEEVVVSVTDQGRGIPADEQAKIFDRFYQVDQSSTRAVGGAGLGLYLCEKLARAIGGRVWLERSDATGSCFCVSIPITSRRHGPAALGAAPSTDAALDAAVAR